MNSCKTDTVKQFLESAVACDWERLGTYCHEQFLVRESNALSYAGVYHGVDGFRKLARLIFVDSFREFQVEPQWYAEGEDHVLLLAAISGVGNNTGLPFSSQVAEIYLFENNLIKEIQPFYWDTKLVNEVMGVGL